MSQPQNLMDLLKLDKLPDMRPASISKMKEVCTRQCSSLVVATEEDIQAGRDACEGHAYLVKNEIEELALRQFKTAIYDIVRCRITISKQGTFATHSDVEGLTFMYTSGAASFQAINGEPTELMKDAVSSEHTVVQSERHPPALTVKKSTSTIHVSPQVAMARPSRSSLVSGTEFVGVWWDDDYDSDDEDIRSEAAFTPAVRPPRLGDLLDHTVAPARGNPLPFRSGLPRSTYMNTQRTRRTGPAQTRPISTLSASNPETPNVDSNVSGSTSTLPTNDSFIHTGIWNANWSAFVEEVEPLKRVTSAELSGSRGSAAQGSDVHVSGAQVTRTEVSVSVQEVNSEDGESDEEERNFGKVQGQSCKEKDDINEDEGDSDMDGGDSGKGKDNTGQAKDDSGHAKDYSIKGEGRSDKGAETSDEQSRPRWKGKGRAASAAFNDKKPSSSKRPKFSAASLQTKVATVSSSQGSLAKEEHTRSL
ncbi:hypothetical protein J1614_012059 [Plenodomus biglobosus]|nr:hypothetical protein J1614_012059 [Plenodomus biglobosus]